MPAVRNTTTSQITGLVSGHRDKAEHFAAEYGVPSSSIYNYENFDQIAHNPAIDAVYVALASRLGTDQAARPSAVSLAKSLRVRFREVVTTRWVATTFMVDLGE